VQKEEACLYFDDPRTNLSMARERDCHSQTAAGIDWISRGFANFEFIQVQNKPKKLSTCRGESSAAGLQLRVRFVPAALLAMLRTALALQCVSKARDWTGHVDR
jgi:hypothetical protein